MLTNIHNVFIDLNKVESVQIVDNSQYRSCISENTLPIIIGSNIQRLGSRDIRIITTGGSVQFNVWEDLPKSKPDGISRDYTAYLNKVAATLTEVVALVNEAQK